MTIKEPHLPYKTRLDVTQSHPLRRTRFGQYQDSSAVRTLYGAGRFLVCNTMNSNVGPLGTNFQFHVLYKRL